MCVAWAWLWFAPHHWQRVERKDLVWALRAGRVWERAFEFLDVVSMALSSCKAAIHFPQSRFHSCLVFQTALYVMQVSF
jgi:hypothetical protein